MARQPVRTAGPVVPRRAARWFFPVTLGPASLAAGSTARGLLPGAVRADQRVECVRVIVGGLLAPADGAGEEPDDDLFGNAVPPLHRFRVTSPPTDSRPA